MRMRLWPALFILFSILLLTSSARAQSNRFGGDNELGFWAGFSPQSGATVGGSPNRKFFLDAVRYSRVLLETRNIGLRYTIDVVPTAVVFQPKNGFGVLSGGRRE